MADWTASRIRVVDSHTGGEPTRVVLDGAPELGRGSLAERRALLRQRYDHFRSAVIHEPRGSDVLVGALLCEPAQPGCVAGAIFFNNVGYLGMCGHGAIGVAVTLAHLGRIDVGYYQLDTPVGVIGFEYHGANEVTIENVHSYRYKANVTVRLDDAQQVTGDIAWGGNWFFLVKEPSRELELAQVDELVAYTWRIRQALTAAGITGADGAEIDHIELFGPPQAPHADSRNFVLCPGKAYDRSPCGTGTSAKVACLAAEGRLSAGALWRQESICGSLFQASYQMHQDQLIPRIRGSAYVTAESMLVLDERDPLRWGIRL